MVYLKGTCEALDEDPYIYLLLTYCHFVYRHKGKKYIWSKNSIIGTCVSSCRSIYKKLVWMNSYKTFCFFFRKTFYMIPWPLVTVNCDIRRYWEMNECAANVCVFVCSYVAQNVSTHLSYMFRFNLKIYLLAPVLINDTG